MKIIIWVGLCLVNIFWAGIPLGAAKEKKGQISFVEKQVKQKGGEEEWSAAQVGNELKTGNKVKTLVESRAELTLEGLSTVRLAPQTTVNIDKLYEETPGKQEEQTTLSVEGGDIWASVNKMDESTRFSVNTKVAGAAIRGTVFRMSVAGDNATEMKVYKGEVAITNAPGKPNLPVREIEPTEVAGPREVAGPKEVSMDEWVFIVKNMQKIKIGANGKLDYAQDFKITDKDEQTQWVKWNQMRDKALEKK